MALDSEIVIDASSALAFLLRERGWQDAAPFFAIGVMSAVNYAEVVQRVRRAGGNPDRCLSLLLNEGIAMVEADLVTAHAAGELEALTRSQGISLADRFCLALAMQRRCPVLTTDKAWKNLQLAVEVKFLR
jgi:PIN domain nuclease of toxin-antitoxin system